MATYYEFALNASPHVDYVNTREDMHYLAWQIGRNENQNKAMWLVAAVTGSPVSENIAFPPHTTGTLTSDVTSYGYTRCLFPSKSITEVVELFDTEVLLILSTQEA